MSEGKTQKESESLADVNRMNQQVSNMAGGFGSTDSRTNDDSQLQEFASEDKGKDQLYCPSMYAFFFLLKVKLKSRLENIGLEQILNN